MSGRLCLLLLCTLTLRVRAEDTAAVSLHPQDFAYSRELSLSDSSAALVAVELPAEVYRASRSAGLVDLVVFNASGAQVPDALQRPAAELDKSKNARPVAFFPVALEQAAAPIELALSITRGSDGQVLALRSPTTPEPQGAVGAYVFDLRTPGEGAETAPPQLVAARFEWREIPKDLILPLSMETSDDLIHWQPVAVEGGILHLEHEAKRIDRDRIEWSPLRADFMRVRALSQRALPTQLQAVYVEAAASRIAPKLERVVVEARSAGSDKSLFKFDLGGPLPVSELEIELPEDNSVVAAELWSADKLDGPYTRLAQTNFYRVSAQDKVLHGPRLQISPQSARYYELRVDPTRARVDNGLPKLVTYHVPERVLFMRRGEAPYTLAYGRHGVQRQRFSANELLHLSTPSSPALATLKERQVAGGEHLLQPPVAPPPYKTYALWAALIAGVAFLAWLSVRLLRGDA